METILITGANGFIGSNLCRYFLNKDFIVFGLVRKTSDLHFLEGLNVKLIYGDLNEIENIMLPENLDYIIHCASAVSDKADKESCQKNIYETTVKFANHILKNKVNLKRFIYISTALVLGYGKLQISEENPGRPANFPYVKYKIKTENFLQEIRNSHRFPLVILRPADVYGPNDRTSCVPILKGIEDGYPVIVGGGKWILPFCYVDNVSLGAYLACTAPNIEGKAYTLTNDMDVTWREFFSVFLERLNKKQKLYVPVFIPFLIAFIMKVINFFIPSFERRMTRYRAKRITCHTNYDISKTIKDLNYKPDKDIKKQFQLIMDWYLAEKKSGYIK